MGRSNASIDIKNNYLKTFDDSYQRMAGETEKQDVGVAQIS